MFSGEFTVCVVLRVVRAEACQRSHHDVVMKIGNSDAEGLEKSRHRREHGREAIKESVLLEMWGRKEVVCCSSSSRKALMTCSLTIDMRAMSFVQGLTLITNSSCKGL